MNYFQRVIFCATMGVLAFLLTIPLSAAMGLATGYFGAHGFIPAINRWYAPVSAVFIVGPISLKAIEYFFEIKRR